MRRWPASCAPSAPAGRAMDAAAAAWARASEAALDAYRDRPGILAFWTPRLANIGAFVLEEEAALRAPGALRACLVEVKGTGQLRLPGGDIEIEARADRLDQLPDGGWRVVDYKTGTVPQGEGPCRRRRTAIADRGLAAGAGRLRRQRGRDRHRPALLAADGRGTGGRGQVARRRCRGRHALRGAGARPAGGTGGEMAAGGGALRVPPASGAQRGGGDFDHLARIEEWSAGTPEAGGA